MNAVSAAAQAAYAQILAANSTNEGVHGLPGTVVSFYSYKGGVGRTMAVVNVAMTFAQNGFRVLVVDLDLQAPGVQEYPLFREAVESSTRYVPPADRQLGQGGMLDLVERQIWSSAPPQKAKQQPFREKCRPVDTAKEIWQKWMRKVYDDPASGGHVDVIPAGPADHRALDTLAQIGWYRFLTKFEGFKLILSMRDQWWRKDYDFTLIDSRTGLSDYLQFCVGILPDVAVVVAGLNEQNLEGLRAPLDGVKEVLASRKSDLYMIPVLSLIPSGDLDHLRDRIDAAEKSLQSGGWALRILGESVRLPYVATLAVTERLIVPRDHHSSIFRQYVRIAEMLARHRFEKIDHILNAAIYEGAATGLNAKDVVDSLKQAHKESKDANYTYGLIRCEKLNAQRLAYGQHADRQETLDCFKRGIALIRNRRHLKEGQPWQEAADKSVGHWQIELETLVFYANVLSVSAPEQPEEAVRAFDDALEFMTTFEKRNYADMFSDRDWDRYSQELSFTRAFCSLGRVEAQIRVIQRGGVVATIQANMNETQKLFDQLMRTGTIDWLERRLDDCASAIRKLS